MTRADRPGGDRATVRRHTPRGSAQQPLRPVDPARLVAYDLLRAVASEGAYANLLLPRLLTERGLDTRDRAFATELGYGTLRALGTLDALLDRHVSGPLQPAVRDALRLGAYQLWRTRVPPRAAVTTTVDLVRSIEPRASRLANAVLRRVADDIAAGDLGGPDPATDPVGALALQHAHPRWIVEAYADALGSAPASTTATGQDELRAALEADDARPQVHLVARRMPRDALLAAAGAGAGPGRWSDRAVYLGGGDPGEVAAVRDGRAAVQDEGSQLVALALAAADAPGTLTIDLTSGPGGKGALLSAAGLEVVGLELHPPRARLVRRSGVPVAVADARHPPLLPGSADRVLLDAPCSGLGALRRRPEARWRRTAADVAPLAVLQAQLLAAAVELLRPGGVVAYVTCSPHRAETVDVVAAELARGLVDPVDARPLLPGGMPQLGDGPSVQLWPHRHGTDAMFLAVLRRR